MKCKNGPTSFHLHDERRIFDIIDLKKGNYFLDLGCGTGDYSLSASYLVGKKGCVYSLDRLEGVLSDFRRKVEDKGIRNIKIIKGDLNYQIALNEKSIDVCLISTVLHCFDKKFIKDFLAKEVQRVIKNGGKLIVIECKKEEHSFGPPYNQRLSVEDLEDCFSQFIKTRYYSFEYTYLVEFIYKN